MWLFTPFFICPFFSCYFELLRFFFLSFFKPLPPLGYFMPGPWSAFCSSVVYFFGLYASPGGGVWSLSPLWLSPHTPSSTSTRIRNPPFSFSCSERVSVFLFNTHIVLIPRPFKDETSSEKRSTTAAGLFPLCKLVRLHFFSSWFASD